jgi:nucleotide-binding universal stress UspA family protein
VVEPLVLALAGDPAAQYLFDYSHIMKMLEDAAATYLDGVAERARRDGVTIDTTPMAGMAAETIARHQAERPGSLVVLGSHGRTGWRAAVLGSVARRVIALAGGPVLVVRPRAAGAASSGRGSSDPV